MEIPARAQLLRLLPGMPRRGPQTTADPALRLVRPPVVAVDHDRPAEGRQERRQILDMLGKQML